MLESEKATDKLQTIMNVIWNGRRETTHFYTLISQLNSDRKMYVFSCLNKIKTNYPSNVIFGNIIKHNFLHLMHKLRIALKIYIMSKLAENSSDRRLKR